MSEYFIMDANAEDMMLLYSVPDPSEKDRWLAGRVFSAPPKEPLEVRINAGFEGQRPLPFFAHPPVMSDEFYEALRDAGVHNIDVYDAVLANTKDKSRVPGYKVFNIIGVVKAADASKTKFYSDNPSRIIDASIDELVLDESLIQDLLLFRLGESVTTIIVHASVKASLEPKGFYGLVFYEPSDVVII